MRHAVQRCHPLAMLAALALCVSANVALAAKPRGEPIPDPQSLPETLTTATVSPDAGARVYVSDIAIGHLPDGRVRVFDARSGRLLGMVSTAYAGQFTLAPRRDELYVATTHLSRTTRGERTDVLEVWDTTTLALKYEVVVPPRHAQALNFRAYLRTSADGQLVYSQNATPAVSVTVVELTGRRVLGEVALPGCFGIYPATGHARRFSALCGDGTVQTVTLADNGEIATRLASAKLFDGDTDPWFQHAEQAGDRYWFLSFRGELVEMDLGGEAPRLVSRRSLVAPAERRQGWRPGGYQLFAVDASRNTVLVGMHPKGGEGSHKFAARQIWRFDLDSGKRVARLPGHGATSMTLARGEPRLHTLDAEKSRLDVWRLERGALKKVVSVAGAGEASFHLESHD
ncbi:MAG: amine dehydrogenase [Burkholderiaceae bacterium]|nr:amine dehydrogenase [Burkholderiaceae bacterium]